MKVILKPLAICGNRFCGYVSMVVSGLFGALSIGLFVYFAIQYFVSLLFSSPAAPLT